MSNAKDGEPPWSTICQNCGAALGGPFCATCGQRAIPPHPTMSELAGHAWEELVGWDGKFLRTLRLLVSKPGELTRAAIEGQRARYVTPVRLYLICSVLYFVVATLAPGLDFQVSMEFSFGVGPAEQTPTQAAIEKAFLEGGASLTPAERALIEAEIASFQPAFLRPTLRNRVDDFAGFQRRLDEITPRVLFLLVPMLAALFALFYRRRHFPEHLCAALHLQAFLFLVATLVTLVRFTQSIAAFSLAAVVGAAAIFGYAIAAQRRVYGGAWPTAVLKVLAVGALYIALWALVTLAAEVWVGASRA